MTRPQHHWVRGAARHDRERLVASLDLPPALVPSVDAHRRLRGPYTAAGTVCRLVVPAALEVHPDLVSRHDVEILSVAPELRTSVPATRETLTSLAAPTERTRYYSRLRTQRLAHGLAEFLRDHVAGTGTRSLVVENVGHSDATDAELLATLLRRIDPGLLTLVVCTDLGELPEGPLAGALDRYATRHEGPATVHPVRDGDLPALASAYVDSDGTSDDPRLLAAYEAVDPTERQRMHDGRAADLQARDEASLRLGAIPFHRENGADRAGAGADALQFAAEHCCAMGFYHATIELAARAQTIVGWEQGPRRFFLTSRITAALAVLGRAPECEELYDEARENTTLPAVHMNAAYATGMLYTRHHETRMRDDRKAKAWVNQAVAIASMFSDPKERVFQSVFMRNGLALVEVHLGDLSEALRLVDEGIALLDRELGPDEHRLHRSVLRYNRGQVNAALGRFDEAVADYTTVIADDPNYAEYHFDRGNLLHRLGRDDEALADYEMAIRLSPPFQEAYYNRGDLRMSRGDPAGALADFGYVLDLDPEFVDAYVNRAGILLAAGDLEAAHRDAVAGLQRDPGNPYLHVVLGQVGAERGDHASARAAFDRAVEAAPDLLVARSGRAAVRYELGDLDGAVADLERVVELAPDDPSALYNRAFAYQGVHRWNEALVDLEAAAELAPDDPDVIRARDECRARSTVA
jgi:tetratricopeptide (TPR) repeat protein